MRKYKKGGGPVNQKNGRQKPKKQLVKMDSGHAIETADGAGLREIAEAGLSELAYNLGLEVMAQLFEQDVEDLVGPKGKHNKNRTANRHGSEETKVVFNDRKISVFKPRVRSGGREIPLPSLKLFQNEDPLDSSILARLLCGVSARKYSRTAASSGGNGACTSKSEVSRRFNKGLEKLMEGFFNRRLEKEYHTIMLDGIVKGGMTLIVALGIDDEGKKEILGLIEGGAESGEVAKRLLGDLIDRGLRIDIPVLFTIDGSKALKKAVLETFGGAALIQRCQVHKKRNVLAHLPESERANIGLAISRAYLEFEYGEAFRRLNSIAGSLESRYPSAAASLREGLEETLTVHRLKVPALLRKTLSNTNAIESANSAAAGIARQVKKWRDGEMLLRHFAAAFLEAEKGFRRVQGCKDIPFFKSKLYDAVSGSLEGIKKGCGCMTKPAAR